MTQSELKTELSYDSETGIFTRNISRGNIKKGSIVSNKPTDRGYIQIKLFNVKRAAHRLAWLYVYGEVPNTIDHINGDKTDNRISNLRNVTQAENTKNIKLLKNNKSGFHGVYKSKRENKWKAQIGSRENRVSLGTFDTKKEAIAARQAAEEIYKYHENHGRM